MRFILFACLILAAISGRPTTPQAAPAVVADIGPVHALASIVMDGISKPELLISPGASPHDYQMRPSDAQKLARADIVIWMGETLTPWLEGPLGALAERAAVLELLRHDQTLILSGEEQGIDPHAWLDPKNAQNFLLAIAAILGDIDPDNADHYAANANSGVSKLDALIQELADQLAPSSGKPFFVAHDAYQYFEKRFGLRALSAIAEGDAAPAGPRRLRAVRRQLIASGARCIFAEPQFPPRLLATVKEGASVKVVLVDPIGGSLELGVNFYEHLLTGMARKFAHCLGQ